MLASQTIEKVPVRNYEFARKLQTEVENLNRCYQCSMCSDGCPVAYAMDYYPHQIIYMSRLGLKDKVLKSGAMWVCVSCETCATRCPNEIEIVHLMDVLRGQALQERVKSPVNMVPEFHKAFVKGIRNRGRVDTVELLLNYELKTRDVFSSFRKLREQASLAWEMLRKGKLKLPFRKKHAHQKTQALVRKILAAR